MSDTNRLPALIKIASNPDTLLNAQHVAAAKLLAFDGEIYPHDGCAITLSVLMQEADFGNRDIFQALALGKDLIEKRGWQKIPLGKQKPGDIGSTCGPVAHHGTDHIYLVLHALNEDEMVIADNQQPKPHLRYASGKGRTPTKFFLRAD